MQPRSKLLKYTGIGWLVAIIARVGVPTVLLGLFVLWLAWQLYNWIFFTRLVLSL
jgi:hypothetical protein